MAFYSGQWSLFSLSFNLVLTLLVYASKVRPLSSVSAKYVWSLICGSSDPGFLPESPGKQCKCVSYHRTFIGLSRYIPAALPIFLFKEPLVIISSVVWVWGKAHRVHRVWSGQRRILGKEAVQGEHCPEGHLLWLLHLIPLKRSFWGLLRRSCTPRQKPAGCPSMRSLRNPCAEIYPWHRDRT